MLLHAGSLEPVAFRLHLVSALCFPDVALEDGRHPGRDRRLRLLDVRQVPLVAEACPHVLSFDAGPFGDRVDLPAEVDGDEAAPVALRKPVASGFEELPKSFPGVRGGPALLEYGLERLCVLACA